jgi:hypothetical protein
MKKILLLLTIPLFLLFLIFHDKGNEFLQPYLSSYLENKTDNNMSIEIKKLQIDYGKIKATALINKITRIKIDGEFSVLEKNLNIDYKLLAKGFKNKNISFKGDIDVNGTAKGHFYNMDIEGKGTAFTSNVSYTFNLKNKKINALKVDMDKANIEELLMVMGQSAYAKGKTDIHLSLPLLEGNISKGVVNINLYETLLNEKLLQEEFDLIVPLKTKITAKIHSKFNNNLLKLQGDIESNLANISFQNAKYNLKLQELQSDYELNIKELKKFQPIMKEKFYGSLALKGEMEYKNKKITLEGQSKSLGGLIQVSLKKNQFFANLQNIYLEKLLYLLGEKPYGKGIFTANINLNNLKPMQGTFKLNSNHIEAIDSTIKKEFNIIIEENINLNIQSKGKIVSDIVYMESKLLTDIVNIQSKNLQYHLKKSEFKGSYNMTIPDLKRMKPFIERPLEGRLDCQGEIQKDKNLLITGKTNNLGGAITFKLKNDDLYAEINNTSVLKLMKMIQYPKTFNANIFGNINYNLKNKKGKVDTQLKQAQLLPNEITKRVKKLRGVDLTKERYSHSTFVAQINNKEVDFNFTAKSKTSELSLNNAHLNLNQETIHTHCTLIIQDKDISGTIKGSIHDPELKVHTSNFIKNEIMNVISEQLDDKTLQEFGIGKEEKKMFKNMFNNFF